MSGSLIMPVILLVIQVGRADVDVDMMMMMMMMNRPKIKVVAFLHFLAVVSTSVY